MNAKGTPMERGAQIHPPSIPGPLWEQIQMVGIRFHYHVGETIYHQNTVCRGVFCVESGRVKISQILDDGTEAILSILSPRCMFGELSVIHSETACPAATAQTAATVLMIPAEKLHELIRTDLDFCHFLIDSLGHKLYTTTEQLFTIAGKKVLRRLAAILLMLDSYGIPRDDDTGFYSITHAELAGISGTTRSNATVFLNQLASHGFVELKRNGIRLLSRKGLEELSGIME